MTRPVEIQQFLSEREGDGIVAIDLTKVTSLRHWGHDIVEVELPHCRHRVIAPYKILLDDWRRLLGYGVDLHD